MLQKGIMKPTLELNRGFFPISTFIRLSTRVWKPDFKLWCTLAGNCVKLTGVKKFKFAELAYATITPNWASISNKNLYAMDTPFWAPILRKPTRKKGKMSIRESQRLIKRSCDPNCYSCFFLIFVILLTTKNFFPDFHIHSIVYSCVKTRLQTCPWLSNIYSAFSIVFL